MILRTHVPHQKILVEALDYSVEVLAVFLLVTIVIIVNCQRPQLLVLILL